MANPTSPQTQRIEKIEADLKLIQLQLKLVHEKLFPVPRNLKDEEIIVHGNRTMKYVDEEA